MSVFFVAMYRKKARKAPVDISKRTNEFVAVPYVKSANQNDSLSQLQSAGRICWRDLHRIRHKDNCNQRRGRRYFILGYRLILFLAARLYN